MNVRWCAPTLGSATHPVGREELWTDHSMTGLDSEDRSDPVETSKAGLCLMVGHFFSQNPLALHIFAM